MKTLSLLTGLALFLTIAVVVRAQGVNISAAGVANPANTFTVGNSEQFQVNGSGNVVKINNVATSFPGTQGAADTYLKNDGSGNLTWAVPASGSISMTSDGGIASTFTNGSGSIIPKGTVVRIMTSTSDRIEPQPAGSELMPIGVAAADIGIGSSGPVTVAGTAQVLVDASSTVTAPGMMIFPSATTDGRVQGTNSPATSTHWNEIGHNLTYSTVNGTLIKVVIHFN